MGNIPKKTAYWVAKKQRQAQRQADIEADRKYPLNLKIKDAMWKALNKLEPLKTLAVIAGTVTVHSFITALDQKTKERILRWELSMILTGPIFGTVVNMGWNAFEDVVDTELVYEDVKTTIHTKQGDYDTYTKTLTGIRRRGSNDKPAPVSGWSFWVLSFFIAYLMVEHGGEIAGMMIEGGKGIGSMVTALVGAA